MESNEIRTLIERGHLRKGTMVTTAGGRRKVVCVQGAVCEVEGGVECYPEGILSVDLPPIKHPDEFEEGDLAVYMDDKRPTGRLAQFNNNNT